MIGLLAILPLSLRIEAGGVGTRTLGVDFGLRRTGLALSSGFAPLPLRVVPCEGDSADGRARARATLVTRQRVPVTRCEFTLWYIQK